MQAILPLAGKGTHLRPQTHTTPKPLLRVANRPVLAHVLDILDGAGVDEIIGIMGHLSGRIEDWLSAERPDLKLTTVEQVEQLGTADAIRLAEPYVDGPVLIVFVDTLFGADLGLIDSRNDVDGIIWAKEVEDYQRFGVILTDEDGCMQRIIEKPSEPISRLANIGLYYIRDWKLLFEGIHHVMAQPPKLGEYFLTDAFQYMIDHGDRILTAEVSHWWDCGKLETLLETNGELLGGGVCVAPTAVVEDSDVGPNVSIGAGSVVRDSRLKNCIVGEHTTLEDCDIEASLIGDHVSATGLRGQTSLGDHSQVAAHAD